MPRSKRICPTPGCGNRFRPWAPEEIECPACRKKRQAAARAEREERAIAESAEIARQPAEEAPAVPQTDPELRAALARTMKQLSKAKASKEELVAAVYQAAADGIRALAIPPVPGPKAFREGHGDPEVAIAVFSDLQLAKRTPTYNTEICERRVEAYAQKVIALTEIQRHDHPVREARVYMLGDLVEGELVFPGQAFQIDASLYRQVTVDGPRIVSNFLRRLLAYFERVHVVGVIGNHGRIGKRGDMSPETNADRMLYSVVKLVLEKEDRITWNIPDGPGERNWHAIDTVGSKRYFLFHGEQMRGGFGGLPFYGFARGVQGWAAGAIPGSFDYALCGHWHQAARLPYQRRVLYVNGSTESYNTFAQEQLKSMSDPAQWLLFAHPERGVTAEYVVGFD